MEKETNLCLSDAESSVPSVPLSVTDEKPVSVNIWKDFVTSSYDIIDCYCHFHYQR